MVSIQSVFSCNLEHSLLNKAEVYNVQQSKSPWPFNEMPRLPLNRIAFLATRIVRRFYIQNPTRVF